MIIPFAGPLDLASTLESGQAFRWRRVDSWFQGVLHDNIVTMRSVPEGVEFTCAPSEETTLEPLVRDYLRLDDDLEAIYSSICVDDRIAAAVAGFRGMRILRQDPLGVPGLLRLLGQLQHPPYQRQCERHVPKPRTSHRRR